MKTFRGAVLVEFALSAPIFFLLLFGSIWYANYFAADATLTSTVSLASRQGFTRGRNWLMQEKIYEDIESWKETGTLTHRLSRMLLSSPTESMDLYHTWSMSVFAKNFNRLNTEYIATILLINENIRNSLSGVRFPCDPTQDDSIGCMKCFYLDIVQFLCNDENGNPYTGGVSGDCYGFFSGGGSVEGKDFGADVLLECKMQPGAGMLSMFDKLLGITGVSLKNRYVLTRRAIISVAPGF